MSICLIKATPTVLDKTLKGIRSVRLDNRKILRALSLRTKYFERFLFFVKYLTNY